MWIVKHRNIFYGISVVLILASVVAFLVWGLKFGIDFKGGSLLEVVYTTDAPETQEITNALSQSGINGSSVRPTEGNGFLIRTPFLNAGEYESAKAALGVLGQFEEKRFDSVGPVIGEELQTKSLWAIIGVLLAIALFVMFAFRHVSKPVASWKYGLVTLVALAHDVIIPLGAFVFLGHFFGAEVDTLFVTAILVVLGFSVHDSIVVFDRVRENLKKNQEKNLKEPFEEVVGRSVDQTLSRSINTSLTTVLALLALYFFGPEASRYFVLALVIGIVAGTYSSVFLGSPLLVTLEKMQKPEAADPKKKK
ncbi:protein translocase subunit SecF [Patescibacteria group bacterium]|nr:protein translocase subunit SecF [Patescibacteria group bacterium]